jgi:geranylgeranyl diphosphate synthase type II
LTPGSRARPRLCLAVAAACGDDAPKVSDAAAASLELLHCASLVHDDLPCFDDADTRRGQPTVHRPTASAWRCWPATG